MITIFSVCHDTSRDRGGIELHASDLGYYWIDGCGLPGRERAPYTVCRVPDTVYDRIYVGRDAPDGRTHMLEPINGRKHAEAIAAPYAHWGVAVAAGDEPTPEELEAAKSQYHAYLLQMLQEGNKLWYDTRNAASIPYFSKVAAQVFGSKVEWLVEVGSGARKRCPNCDAAAPQTAAWCACGYIYDMAQAVAGGFLPAIQAQAAVIAAAAAAEAEEPVAAAGGRRKG